MKAKFIILVSACLFLASVSQAQLRGNDLRHHHHHHHHGHSHRAI